MKNFSISSNELLVCESYYQMILDHLNVMNSWKEDPETVSKFPFLLEKEFTFEDSFHDLLMKGLL